MAMSQDQLKMYLTKAFPNAVIEIKDLAGDNDHFAATITSSVFQGKTRIQQHKMVFDALTGFTDIASTREFNNQMATTIIVLKEWAEKNKETIGFVAPINTY